MSKYRHAGLLNHCVGDVSSAQLGRHILRRETATVDGVIFYKFTLNQGFFDEYSTFWSEDETTLLRRVYRKAGIPFA